MLSNAFVVKQQSSLAMSQLFELWSPHAPALINTTMFSALLVICSSLLPLVLILDYLYYYRLRKELGPDIPIVGDAPYIWRRLRWTENEVNFRGVLQRGYDSVNVLGERDTRRLIKCSSARISSLGLTGASTMALSLSCLRTLATRSKTLTPIS